MDYQRIYSQDYFQGKNTFFYKLGYGRYSKYFFDSLYRPLPPYLAGLTGGKVLDIGCAYGFMLQRFPERFQKFGIDISEFAITEARKRHPEYTLAVGNAEDSVPWPKNSFDVVISNDVLEHLERPDQALAQMYQALKPNGLLYINTPNLNWLRKKLYRSADRQEHHISLLTHQALGHLLQSSGFSIIDHWTHTDLTYFFFTKLPYNLGPESAFICRKN